VRGLQTFALRHLFLSTYSRIEYFFHMKIIIFTLSYVDEIVLDFSFVSHLLFLQLRVNPTHLLLFLSRFLFFFNFFGLSTGYKFTRIFVYYLLTKQKDTLYLKRGYDLK